MSCWRVERAASSVLPLECRFNPHLPTCLLSVLPPISAHTDRYVLLWPCSDSTLRALLPLTPATTPCLLCVVPPADAHTHAGLRCRSPQTAIGTSPSRATPSSGRPPIPSRSRT